MKRINIRLTKKVVIPVVAVFLIAAGIFAVKSIIYNNKKEASAAAASEAYKALSSSGSKRVIIKIDGVDVTYGELICAVKLGDAYSNNSGNYNEKEKIKNAFIDEFCNITQYCEVTKMMNEEKGFEPDSDQKIKTMMKGNLESQAKSSDPEVAGVAEVKLKHIDEDFESYKKLHIVTQWINRSNSGIVSSNMTEDEAKNVNTLQNAEIKTLVNAAIDNSKIEYVDQSYSYLTKDLIPKP